MEETTSGKWRNREQIHGSIMFPLKDNHQKAYPRSKTHIILQNLLKKFKIYHFPGMINKNDSGSRPVGQAVNSERLQFNERNRYTTRKINTVESSGVLRTLGRGLTAKCARVTGPRETNDRAVPRALAPQRFRRRRFTSPVARVRINDLSS